MAEKPTDNNTDDSTQNQSSTEVPSGNQSTDNTWRAPANSRFAGKTAEEILGIADASLYALDRVQQQQYVPPVQQQQQQNRFDLDIPDDEYLNGAQLKRIISQIASQPAPVDYTARQQSAGALLSAVQMQRADDFRRWGPEINIELQKLPMESWTLDNLKILVDIVKSRHIDELAAEKAEQLRNDPHPTIRAGGGSGGGTHTPQLTLEQDGLPKDWVDKLRAQGIDEAKVQEFCNLTGQTVAQYYKDVMTFGKSGVIHG